MPSVCGFLKLKYLFICAFFRTYCFESISCLSKLGYYRWWRLSHLPSIERKTELLSKKYFHNLYFLEYFLKWNYTGHQISWVTYIYRVSGDSIFLAELHVNQTFALFLHRFTTFVPNMALSFCILN